MSFLGGWFGTKAVRGNPQDAEIAGRISAWKHLPEADLSLPLNSQRWLVVDVETTGLDMHRDRLLAIGAIVVEGRLISIRQSFEVVLRQKMPSQTTNILIHRIPGTEQMDGVEPPVALTDFLGFAQKLPCVAFHAAFDETMLRRACRDYLGFDFAPQFIDLALLAPALCPDAPRGLRSLDDWIGHFGITIGARHRAVADALGTAQLLQALLLRAEQRDIASAQVLFKLARDQRWLESMSRN